VAAAPIVAPDQNKDWLQVLTNGVLRKYDFVYQTP
jgi:hypothetical protein